MGVFRQSRGKVRDREERKRALLSAANKLFASRGYDATTTREIAACAGCAEGLIHRYFNGKAGLLLDLIRSRVSQEVVDLGDKLPLADTIEEEILQIVKWEVDHLWADRDFLRVIIPRALVDPALGPVVSKIGPAERAKAIAKRLRRYPESRTLPDQELEVLADFLGIMGFMFGFQRPVVLGHDCARARQAAVSIARLLTRNLFAGNLVDSTIQELSHALA
jgi:AcrR family transcriptional regulator